VAEIGFWALVFTLVVSVYTSMALIMGARRAHPALVESGRNGIFVTAVTSTIASAALMYLLVTRDFGVRYVYEHVSTYLAPAYTVSAFWAGQQGSLLVWMWLVALLATAMVTRKQVWREALGPYSLAVVICTQAFLALVLLLASNPFETLPATAPEGQGLNPLLENFWMIVHPPVVFMGYAGYTAPFALALAGLITGQLGREWVQEVRRWALLAWLLLGVGILLGAWWAYLELGWGGYWGWDPVENSSLIPWLTGTALLHSLVMQQHRGSFRICSLSLISLTFALCIFATFVTRSGIIQSVHAFGRSPVGYYFMGFTTLSLLAPVRLLYSRRQELGGQQKPGLLLSRESSLFLTNLLFGGMAVAILLGTTFPAMTELFQGRQVALGVPFYERTMAPMALAMVLLVGLCPRLAWGGLSLSRLRRELTPPALAALVVALILFSLKIREAVALLSFSICCFVAASILMSFYQDAAARHRGAGESLLQAVVSLIGRTRSRYGGHVVHLAVVLITIGVTGSSIYQREVLVALAPGERIDFQGYTLEYQNLVNQITGTKQQFVALVGIYRGGRRIATLRPEKNFHWNVEQWVTEVDIHTSLREDLYLILANFEEDGLVTLQILVNPLVAWLWVGGVVLLAGTAMAWWPSPLRE
jgi:cytochrome c-type biogenesis protein CcmF